MKFFLTITLCSVVEMTCINPYTFPTFYADLYSCQIDGYKKSVEKIQEIGSEDINRFGIYAKFSCKLMNTT